MYRTYAVTAATGPDIHHDTLLSNVAVAAFAVGTDELIADQLFPSIPVGKQSDRYAIIDKGNFLRRPDTVNGVLRAPGTEARRVIFEVSSDKYFADGYALASEIPLEDLANADQPFRLRENTTTLITGLLRREQEIRIAQKVTTAANVGSAVALTGTAKWSDFANSDPIADVTTGHAFIRNNTGLVANTLVIDYDTVMIVRRHPELLDMYKYSRSGQITMQELADCFKVGRILVGRAVMENALEGGTSSMTNVWGNNALLAHVEPAVGQQTRTLGLRFNWRPEGFPAPLAVASRREAGAGTRYVEIEEVSMFQDEKIIAKELGYLIADTL